MTDTISAFITSENRAHLELREQHLRDVLIKPELTRPWLRPCRVRVLLVADGLDFSPDDFGLSTFVTTLLETRSPARFDVSLAHLLDASGPAMFDSEPRIVERIAKFAFDDNAHFTPEKYDVVFLFGIASSLNRVDANGQTRIAANGQPYPFGELAATELQALAEFENSGGGLFATGDHGALGRFMGRAVPRARNMRYWDSTSPNGDVDEVSMGGPRRNDTNRLGDVGSQFEDQSDDIPQRVEPKLYTARTGLFRYTFPHPLLCGPRGVIRVMPDHPHEGECIEPPDTSLMLDFTAPLGPEYPPAADGGPRPLPEVVSTNAVLAGTTSGGKSATIGHSFGGICAYDGHRAGVGRVVTDSTWHHFVNINLIGQAGFPDPVKSLGFLASVQGQAHLEDVKTYYRNLAVWLARPHNIRCMNRRLLLSLLENHRVMEAVLTTREIGLERIDVGTLALLGEHALDVLGKFASRCQARRLAIDLTFPEFNPFLQELDPWRARLSPRELLEQGFDVPERGEAEVNWIEFDRVLPVSLGAALATINERFSLDARELDEDAVEKAAVTGAKRGLALALDAIDKTAGHFRRAMHRR